MPSVIATGKVLLGSLALLSLLLGAAAVGNAAPLTYQVDRTVGAATVIGEFTTDGTLGSLAASDFLSWDLTLSEGGLTFTLDETNSIVIGPTGTSAVQATATQVTFDPSVGNYFAFYHVFETFWCLQASQGQCVFGGEAVEAVRIFDHNAVFASLLDVQPVGTRVETDGGDGGDGGGPRTAPEAASLVLFALGVVGIGFSRRRRALKGSLLAFALAVGAASTANAASLTINTDSSWLATNALPGATWNTDPSFDTTGWTNAVVSTVTPAPCFNGADCIWFDDQQSATQAAWLRKTFTISDTVLTAVLDGGVDDDADIYLNGTCSMTLSDHVAGSLPCLDSRSGME